MKHTYDLQLTAAQIRREQAAERAQRRAEHRHMGELLRRSWAACLDLDDARRIMRLKQAGATEADREVQIVRLRMAARRNGVDV